MVQVKIASDPVSASKFPPSARREPRPDVVADAQLRDGATGEGSLSRRRRLGVQRRTERKNEEALSLHDVIISTLPAHAVTVPRPMTILAAFLILASQSPRNSPGFSGIASS